MGGAINMTGSVAGVLVALFSFWFFSTWHSYEEVTVHAMYCAGDHPGGRCSKGEEIANPTTYRAYPDQQTVIKWTWNSGTITRFTFCAVRDGRNWTCQFEKAGDVPKVEYTMMDGFLSTTDFRKAEDKAFSSVPPDPFYEVSRWYWWFVWVREHIGQGPR
jgi:hypothetical protein